MSRQLAHTLLADLALPLMLIATACTTPPGLKDDGGSAPSAIGPGTNHSGPAAIHGVVLGYSETAAGSWTTEPVGGTKVEYATFAFSDRDSTGGVGAVLGSVTADEQGLFTVTGISAGWYALRFTPLLESPYAGGLRKVNTEEIVERAVFSLLRK